MDSLEEPDPVDRIVLFPVDQSTTTLDHVDWAIANVLRKDDKIELLHINESLEQDRLRMQDMQVANADKLSTFHKEYRVLSDKVLATFAAYIEKKGFSVGHRNLIEPCDTSDILTQIARGAKEIIAIFPRRFLGTVNEAALDASDLTGVIFL